MTEGISIYEYQPKMMHTKALVVDGVWSMFGSANFDNRSLELNDELNVAVSDPRLAARLTADFDDDLRRARQLEPSSWNARPPLEKVRESFWSYFSEVF
jgi:cardiolipin synthase